MTIKQIYNLAIELGITADPRGKLGVAKWLDLQKKSYLKLEKEKKELYDKEKLTNPYADTRFHFGDPDTKVKTILAGIEIEEAEIALASAMDNSYQLACLKAVISKNTKNPIQITNNHILSTKPDLIITHHPVGKALAALDDVMKMQADMMASYGVPINVAEGVMKERMQQVSRSIAPINHMRPVDAAKMANIPYMNIHTPADNLVFQYLQKMMDRKKPETVGEILEILNNIPEYKEATKNNAGPRIFAGDPGSRCGKIVCFDITGGTSGAKEIYPELVRAGVGTVISMHMKDESRDEAIKNHLNVVIAGHISSDSIGMNLLLDKLAQKGIKIIPTSGLIRVKRNK